MADEEKTEVIQQPLVQPEIKLRKLYFINEDVEYLLTKYLWTGCTDIELRDQIMSNASELIRQIIRKQGLHTIYPGQEESAFGDLLQTAWCQIERVLYKYRSAPHCRYCYDPDRPSDSQLYLPKDREYGIKTVEEVLEITGGKCRHCKSDLNDNEPVGSRQGVYGGTKSILFRGKSKVFNMWSQIARTVILAFIKKEGRDRKNSNSYQSHLGNRCRPNKDLPVRFIIEAKEVCKFHDDYLILVDALEDLMLNDDRPYDGIIGKLTRKSNLSRATVTSFIKFLKMRSHEFTDSPINRNTSNNKGKMRDEEDEEE